MVDIIGYIAGAFTLTNMFPQVIKTYKTKRAEDVSFLMVLIFALSMIFWTIYGFMIGSIPIIITDIIGFIISCTQLILMLRYKKRLI